MLFRRKLHCQEMSGVKSMFLSRSRILCSEYFWILPFWTWFAWWKKFGNCLGFEELGKVTLEFSIHQQFWKWSVDLGNYGGVAINWEEFQKYWGIVVNSLGVRSRLFRWFYVKIVVGDRSKVFIKFLGVVVVS